MAFPDGIADFRSDTVSRPTQAMRRAMAEAEVGDDVYGEDPTVNLLEEESAAVVGKEAAVFVPTGSMGNQLAIWCQAGPGTEVICVDTAHVRNYERGAAAIVSSVQFRTVTSPDGNMSGDQIRTAASGSEYHLPPASLLTWENTHNASGGTIVPFSSLEEGRRVAEDFGLAVHLDGARLFNVVAATGLDARGWAGVVDTVQFCFSKGLGAPVGSVLCGSADLVAEARYRRKILGGGMRQVGIMAAAARLALAGRDRVADDHEVAHRLAAGIADRHPGAVKAPPVTNMVLVDEHHLPGGVGSFRSALAEAQILVSGLAPGLLRFVTHHDVDETDVNRVLTVLDGLGN